LQSCDYE
jgi:hypothetical protein